MKRYFELFSVDPIEVPQPKPTPAMVKTLVKCFELEIHHPGKPYGPRDIRGSFNGLYNRGLLDIKISDAKNGSTTSWFITSEGLHFLLLWIIRHKKLIPYLALRLFTRQL